MEAYITKKGGGGKLYAAVGVNFPEGSSCTCTSKTTGKVLRAKSDKKTIFSIPNGGQWEVKSTLGLDEAKETITVNQYDCLNVSLTYWDGTLYRAGDVYPNVTGGWGSYGYKNSTMKGSMTDSGGVITITTTGGNIAVCPNEKIDLTDYTTLSVEVSNITVSTGSTIRLFLFVSDDDGSKVTLLKEESVGSSLTSGVRTMDVSELTGKHYIGVGLTAAGGVTYTVKFTEAYLT